MKFKRIKYTRTTPKSQTVHSLVSFNSGDGFDKLLAALAKVIEKCFGILYVSIYTVGK